MARASRWPGWGWGGGGGRLGEGGGATFHEFIFAAKMKNTLAARAINGVGVGSGTMNNGMVGVEGAFS